MKAFFSQKTIFGAFMVLFLGLCGLCALPALYQSYEKTGQPRLKSLIHGEWTAGFEDQFAKQFYFYEDALHAWGWTELTLFHQGRPGVVIGKDDWLFSTEEFTHPKNAEKNIDENLHTIEAVQEQLTQKHIRLLIIPIPAKARIEKEHLGNYVWPEEKKRIYDQIKKFLNDRNIDFIDLQPILEKTENAFLKTDTHWSPAGANAAAQAIKKSIKEKLHPVKFRKTDIKSQDHQGDLLRYIPAEIDLKPDKIETYDLENSENTDLFADQKIDITLVGTSYSANPLWGFENVLKLSLKTDVLNMADEGLGPFETMQRYLQSDELKSMPPKIVIWEIPERYLSFIGGKAP